MTKQSFKLFQEEQTLIANIEKVGGAPITTLMENVEWEEARPVEDVITELEAHIAQLEEDERNAI